MTILGGEQTPALEVQGLRKSFGDRQVLSDLELTVHPGEVMGVVGHNGAGKSTLAALLSGALDVDAGEFQVNGSPWSPERVSLIEQDLPLDPNATVVETMLRFTDRNNLDEDPDLIVRRALVDLGVPVLPGDRISELSDSERRLIEIARLLIDAREVIVMDEVTATLNAGEVEGLRYVLSRAVADQRAVLYITHRLNEALEICDRVAVLRAGRISETFSALTTDSAALAEAIFDQQPNQIRRQNNASAQVMLSVRGLQVGAAAVDFDVRAGEVVGLCGPRDSVVRDIVDAVSGERPRTASQILLAGKSIEINSTMDATAESIAVLSGVNDPRSEARFAQNLMMLNGDRQEDFEAEFADATKILMAIRKSEEAGDRLLHRSGLSMGERRWQQLREIAAEQAQLMVLIEPDQGLDLKAQEHFLALLDDVTSRGVAVLLVSSDESVLHAISDRIWVFDSAGQSTQWDPDLVTVADLAAVSRGEDIWQISVPSYR